MSVFNNFVNTIGKRVFTFFVYFTQQAQSI